MRRLFDSRKRMVTVGIAIVAVIAMSIGAFAYWTSTGSGTGSGSTGTAGNNLVIHGTAVTALTPGTSSPVTFTVDNPSNFAQQLSNIHLASVAAYDTALHAAAGGPLGLIAGCGGVNTGAVTLATGSDFWMVDVTVPIADGHIAASAVGQALTTTATLHMNDLSAQNQDTCKNAFLRLDLTTIGLTVRYVATTGADTSPCLSSATPCLTLAYAVGQANPNETIQVAAGSYPEVVSVTKSVIFKGANAGIKAGVNAGSRGAESVVKGFRNPGNPGTTSFDVTIDGFRIDPQGDAALISATASPLVWLRGGTNAVLVRNNVFNGGPFVANCTYTCTTMTDYAFTVQSGPVQFADNTVMNFRRPVNINQNGVTPTTSASLNGNAFTGITSRAVSLGGSTGVQMPGQQVTGNTFDATGITGASSPAGITVSNGGNTISANTFTMTAAGSGVYIDLCKKFITNNNSITNNVFTGNGAGVNINVNMDGGQCESSNTEGSGGWVTGGGRINGLTVAGNNFVGNSVYAIRHAAYNWGFWGTTAPISTAPINATCNWWNSVAGPTVVSLTYPNPLIPVADQLVNTTGNPPGGFKYSPWRTAAAPGGACNGT